MRIAFITWCVPYPPDTGGKNRTYNILRYLAQRHEVDVYVPSYVPVDDFGDLTSFCRRVEIHRHEGTINQFTGDGVMALFGAPVALEDHAQAACYSALSIQNSIRDYEKEVKKNWRADFTALC